MRIRPGASSRQLHIRHSSGITPWFWGVLLIALATTLWMYRGGLECERATDACTLGARGMPGIDARSFALSSLRKAELVMRTDQESSNDTSRVVLHVGAEELVLGIGWSAFNDGNRRNADRINAFLADPQVPQLRAWATEAWLPLLLIPVGALIILFGRSSWHAQLDRAAGRFSIARTGLFRTRQQHGDLDGITGTLIVQRRGSKSTREQLGLLGAGASFLALGPLGHSSRKRIRADGRSICEFLGLDAACAVDPDDVGISNREALSMIGSIDPWKKEADSLRARLEQNPDSTDDFRRLAICLMRLERRAEAAEILRNAYRHFLDRGRRADANRMAAVLRTFKI
jgi:hypothetical protein